MNVKEGARDSIEVIRFMELFGRVRDAVSSYRSTMFSCHG